MEINMKTHQEVTKESPLEIDAVVAGIIPYLNIKDIPNVARVKKSSAAIIHKLNQSEKFLENSKIKNTVVKETQEAARVVLSREPMMNPNEKLLLEKLARGEYDEKAVSLLDKKTIQFKSHKQEFLYSAAKASARFADTMLVDQRSTWVQIISGPREPNKFEVGVALVALGVAAISAVAGYVWGYFEDRGKAKDADKLRKRLEFFRDHPEKKPDDKSPPPDKDKSSTPGMLAAKK